MAAPTAAVVFRKSRRLAEGMSESPLRRRSVTTERLLWFLLFVLLRLGGLAGDDGELLAVGRKRAGGVGAGRVLAGQPFRRIVGIRIELAKLDRSARASFPV